MVCAIHGQYVSSIDPTSLLIDLHANAVTFEAIPGSLLDRICDQGQGVQSVVVTEKLSSRIWPPVGRFSNVADNMASAPIGRFSDVADNMASAPVGRFSDVADNIAFNLSLSPSLNIPVEYKYLESLHLLLESQSTATAGIGRLLCSTRRYACVKAEVKCSIACHGGTNQKNKLDCPNISSVAMRIRNRDSEAKEAKRLRCNTAGQWIASKGVDTSENSSKRKGKGPKK